MLCSQSMKPSWVRRHHSRLLRPASGGIWLVVRGGATVSRIRRLVRQTSKPDLPTPIAFRAIRATSAVQRALDRGRSRGHALALQRWPEPSSEGFTPWIPTSSRSARGAHPSRHRQPTGRGDQPHVGQRRRTSATSSWLPGPARQSGPLLGERGRTSATGRRRTGGRAAHLAHMLLRRRHKDPQFG